MNSKARRETIVANFFAGRLRDYFPTKVTGRRTSATTRSMVTTVRDASSVADAAI